MMKHTRPQALRASAVSLAVAGMLMAAGSAYAGKIDNLNNTSKLGACVALNNPGTPEDESLLSPAACIGAWNLGNVDVKLVKIETGVESDFFDKVTGVYTAMTYGDSFVSIIKDSVYGVMARLTGKDWPVGEPTGIKAVNGDTPKEGKPQNCLINTAYLGADLTDKSTDNDVDAYLNSTTPNPVLCSSGFQSHKRFKVAMQPATAEVADGAEGKPIDLVFNVTEGGGLTPYQVFSKINNYTDKRLKGYKIVVGQGVGVGFHSAGALGIADRLHISLGIGEGWSSGENAEPDGSDLFDSEDGLATFSHGLFGAPDEHFDTNGFFDTRPAGFKVTQFCSEGTCTTYDNPFVGGVPLINSDTIYSTGLLASNYTTLFGDWLPSKWQPKGIFWDFDNDPTTDPTLMAWWNGSAWIKNYDSGFATVTADELNTWASDPQKLYAIDSIEDVLNLGINYIVKVGDDLDNNGIVGDVPSSQITIRIIPVVADTQVAPSFVGSEPPALEPAPVTPPVDPVVPVTTTSDGGGCSASTGNNPVDPVLPLLAALGLAGWGLRRARRS